MVILVLVLVARDIPLDAESPGRGFTGCFIVDTLRGALVDEEVTPKGEQAVLGEVSVSARKGFITEDGISTIEAEDAVDRDKDLGGGVAVDGDREWGFERIKDVVKIVRSAGKATNNWDWVRKSLERISHQLVTRISHNDVPLC